VFFAHPLYGPPPWYPRRNSALFFGKGWVAPHPFRPFVVDMKIFPEILVFSFLSTSISPLIVRGFFFRSFLPQFTNPPFPFKSRKRVEASWPFFSRVGAVRGILFGPCFVVPPPPPLRRFFWAGLFSRQCFLWRQYVRCYSGLHSLVNQISGLQKSFFFLHFPLPNRLAQRPVLWSGLGYLIHGQWSFGRPPCFFGPFPLPLQPQLFLPFRVSNFGALSSVWARSSPSWGIPPPLLTHSFFFQNRFSSPVTSFSQVPWAEA